MSEHACIDCQKDPPKTVRKIVTGEGEAKRCTTHQRRFATRQRQKAHARHVERTYDISAIDAAELLNFQNGKCWICQTATGASKNLAVDHDHADDWARGRLCSTCNQFIGRQLHDDPTAAVRLMRYLVGETPYRLLLAQRLIRNRCTMEPFSDLRIDCTAPPDVIVWYLIGGIWCQTTTTLDELQSYATPKGSK